MGIGAVRRRGRRKLSHQIGRLVRAATAVADAPPPTAVSNLSARIGGGGPLGDVSSLACMRSLLNLERTLDGRLSLGGAEGGLSGFASTRLRLLMSWSISL